MVRHRPSSNSRAYKVLGGTPETEIRFQLPGVRIEHVQAGRHRFCGLTAVTPIDSERTAVNHVIYWTMPWLTPLKPLLRPFARAFLEQDRRVVETPTRRTRIEPEPDAHQRRRHAGALVLPDQEGILACEARSTRIRQSGKGRNIALAQLTGVSVDRVEQTLQDLRESREV